MTEYRIRSVPPTDVWAALLCEADRADSEQMHQTGKRQRQLAVHVRNATAHMAALCPEGMRVELDLVVHLVPAVNPVAIDPTPSFVR